ncbi:hypothetical protein CJU90_1218 [Yarrowia sp. C11]|nr:hypothetical protein CKK34_2632 [Yarrowia sp. E02]KAG5373505.1 hypothetical protein CJU90_1218 [Yarrowia sp. C11]
MNSNMKKAPPTASKTHLSSKLNNMKFMQRSSDQETKKEEEKAQKKIDDASKWTVKGVKAPRIKKRSRKIVSVGYSDIALAEDTKGRLSWGGFNDLEDTKKPVVDTRSAAEIEKEEYELLRAAAKNQGVSGSGGNKAKKRPSEGGDNGGKKKMKY